MSFIDDLMVTICTDFSKPLRIGPTTVQLPISSNNFVAMLAECKPGQMSIFAGAVKRQNE